MGDEQEVEDGGKARPGEVKKPLILWGDTLTQCEAGPEKMDQNSWPWALGPHGWATVHPPCIQITSALPTAVRHGCPPYLPHKAGERAVGTKQPTEYLRTGPCGARPGLAALL